MLSFLVHAIISLGQPASTQATAMIARIDGQFLPLPLQRLDVSIEIVGQTARTTYDMTFTNPHQRPLEGRFVFPLLDQQIMVQYDQMVQGSWREGVVVERTKGQQVYESIVRKEVDPGLLSWIGGNTFQARFFPILPDDALRIRVAVEEPLQSTAAADMFRHRLRFPDTVGVFTYQWRVLQPGGEVSVIQSNWEDLSLQTEQLAVWGEVSARDVLPEGTTTLQIARPKDQSPVWIEEVAGGATFFQARLFPQHFLKARQLPKEVVVLWDVSHSRREAQLDQEIDLLRQLLTATQPERLGFVTFAQEILQTEVINWDPDRLEAWLEKLRQLPLDGATHLGALDLKGIDGEEFWLFTDGRQTFGATELQASDRPIYTITSTPGADVDMLRNWSFASRGNLMDLLHQSIEECMENWRVDPLRLVEVRTTSGQIAEAYPKRGTPAGESLTLSGKLLTDEAHLTVVLADQHGQKFSQRLLLDKVEQRGYRGTLSRTWARQALQSLSPRTQQAAIVRLAQSYGLATPFTSFLVLEDVADYVAYDVSPPPALRAEYEALKAQAEQNQRTEWLSHLDKVARDYLQRRVWWETKFAAPTTPFVPDSIRKNRVMDETTVEANPAIEQEESMSLDQLSDLEAPLEVNKAELHPEEKSDPTPATITIELRTWQGDAPYLKVLAQVDSLQRFETYLGLKDTYGLQPAFFVQVANWFWARGDTTAGLRILSNLAELELGNHELLRLLGHQLEQIQRPDLAIPIYLQVKGLRAEEPQSYRDLALAYARNGQLQEAVDGLWEVIRRPWDERFPQIGALAAQELNAILALTEEPINTSEIDQRFIGELPTDLRVVLEWDADNVDMDLWVTDPRGEKCYYQHDLTLIGGIISADFTRGYGPEEFLLKKAPPGTYKVEVNYYGSRQARLAGPVRVYLSFVTDYGLKTQRKEEVILELSEESEVVEVGRFEVKP